MLIVAACSSVPRQSNEGPVTERSEDGGRNIAGAAAQLVGVPYEFGGADLKGFDCSGLAAYVYAQAGVEIPRTAEAQRRAARPVSADELSPGDLVFFRIHSRHVNHVGIYTGGGQFVHAPRSGERVSYGSLSAAYYHKHFAGGGRFWSGKTAAIAGTPAQLPSPH